MAGSYTPDWFLAGFGVFTFIIGVVLYFVYSWQNLTIQQSKIWPSVVGTITASALENESSEKSTVAAIRYRYRVAATDYEGTRISWAPQQGRRDAMAALVAEYPVGRDVWVQHDPKDPAKAVLRPDIVTGLTPLFYYAMGLMTLGILALGGGLYALSH
jgi:hypothetical protein